MKKVALRTVSLTVKIFVVLAGLVAIALTWLIIQFPSDKDIKGCLITKLYNVDLCPKSKNYVRLNQISDYLIKAVVLTEDSSFYSHKGFDFQEMENSLKSNLQKGTYVRGGSTITQQLAKNLFLSKEKTLRRKLLEALITIRMEKVLSKKEILEKYLNVVQFGKDIFGVKSAAEFYFKKSPASLSLPEAAFLTFLLPSPEKYSKSYFKGELTPFARQRLQQIIDRMVTYNRITQDEYLIAKSELSGFINGGKHESDLDFDQVVEEDIQFDDDAGTH